MKTAKKNIKNRTRPGTLEEEGFLEKLPKGVESLKERIENISNLHSSRVSSERDEGDGESIPEVVKEDTDRSKVSTVSKTATSEPRRFSISVEVDVLSSVLFLFGLATRMYRLEEPRSIVFDELHYGKYVSLYMKQTFFFDSHPPLGKQLIAAVAYLAGFDGQFKFDRIGSSYADTVPLFALRLVPAVCGSLLIPTAYHLMLEMGLSQWTAALAGFLLLCDNAMLTQSRFILMESMLLLFALFGLLCILKFRHYHTKPLCLRWWLWLSLGAASLTCALWTCCYDSDACVEAVSRYWTMQYDYSTGQPPSCPHGHNRPYGFSNIAGSMLDHCNSVKYVGFFSCCLGLSIVAHDYWRLVGNKELSDGTLLWHLIARSTVLVVVPLAIYLSVFYVHLAVLYRAGPHDSVMTSAFQASLEGGLASITKGQPLEIAHGSQVTLRHSHGRTCWLHSHPHVYPIRYPDKRGSSHQQQVTCYSFKDVNNWWIVKRPLRNDLVVSQPVDAIRHGDVIQLVHGMTSRALNSHDVAAPVSPQNQEVSCYIDYNVSMPAQNLWRVDIINRDQVGDIWHTIESLVHLVHVNSSQALKFSGRQLPDWGFHQHEVVTDRNLHQDDTVWNVEEHRYTKSEDQKDRERDLVNAEMIPLRATTLTFWEKFIELQYKMLFANQENVQNHMYSSEPFEWPLMMRGIAYWVSPHSNAQVHLLGNVVIWYSGSVCLLLYCGMLVVYLLRRRRLCYDLSDEAWESFLTVGKVLLVGFLFHYLPYFFVERTLFLHHYLPAFTFKVLLMAALLEHLHHFLSEVLRWRLLPVLFRLATACWLLVVLIVFRRFSVLSYGTTPLTAVDVLRLRWQDTWDFIVHRE